MWNLKLKFCNRLITEVFGTKNLLIYENDVYFVTTDTIYRLLCADTSQAGYVSMTKLFEQPNIVGVEYLALEDEICVASGAGEVLLINPQTGAIREGTFCSVGIACMAWSPDQDIVVFATKEQNVVIMTCTYDPITEHRLSDPEVATSPSALFNQFVNVGWGKKETQFHGSAGKSAAKATADFRPPTTDELSELSLDIEITWRGDGAYFVVSFVSGDYGRMFKVFDREGTLTYASELLNGLESPISWRPCGTWITVPQRLVNKSTIALFEKNGLRHREIVLPFKLDEDAIVSMKWSMDSSILAFETRSTLKSSLYFYTVGNYHWYLKQLFSFNAATSDAIATFRWDTRIGEERTVHVVLQSGCYLIYRWQFSVDRADNCGIVAVIDGANLLLTDFRKAIVPPPMCSTQLVLEESSINACSVIKNGPSQQLHLGVLDAKNNLHIFKSTNKDSTLTSPTQSLQFEHNICRLTGIGNPESCIPFQVDNIFWLNEKCLLVICCEVNTSNIFLITSNATVETAADEYAIRCKVTVDGIICAICAGQSREELFVHTNDGRIQIVTLRDEQLMQLGSGSIYNRQLGHIADQMLWYNGSHDIPNAAGLITLQQQNGNCLHIDAKQLGSNVTSFCLCGNYLMYTDVGTLYFVRLTDRCVVSTRRIEHGAKLLTATEEDALTVLQMPRGNLEAIYPRVLVLELVGALLDHYSYSKAMNLLRKHRINLNIICDHDLRVFVDHVYEFLNEMQNVHWLNLFINDLQNQDFTLGMYASNYSDLKRKYPDDLKTLEQKVQYVCEQLLVCMEQRGEKRFQLPIITCYVKLEQLEKALKLIWDVKQQEYTPQTPQQQHHTSSEELLKYLLYLVDINELYNIALGTYDLGLVLFVAEKSQRDPKEFLPFLNELKKFPVEYRKFKIDEHLKRYKNALHHIAKCPSDEYFEEALTFVQRHHIYATAIIAYAAQTNSYRRICHAFADYLRGIGKLENASLMYERGGNLPQAILSAKHIMDWQRVLALTRKNENAQQVATVALSLVSPLQEHGHFLEAYELQKTYGVSFKEAVQCLLRGKLFLKAIFETRMAMLDEADLVLPDLLNYRILLERNLVEDRELFLNYKQRLLAVREQNEKNVNNGQNETFTIGEEVDLISDTTSVRSSRYSGSSGTSGKTFRSGKSRRKHERKIFSLKPGNPFEDIALIDALHTLIEKSVHQQQHVHDICKALMELQHDGDAFAVQQQFKTFMQLLKDSLDDIWIPEMITMTTNQQSNINYINLRNEKRYAIMEPQKRYKPKLNIIDWEHEILR